MSHANTPYPDLTLLRFDPSTGLLPVIIQDSTTLQVLMLGYMNEEAYAKTLLQKKVTFFSRSKNRLWTKGETSGHFLWVKEIHTDCDQDSLLIKASPDGPTCHKGAVSCFGELTPKGFLYQLESVIEKRLKLGDAGSYTARLADQGMAKVAQKVGEEAVELILEAMRDEPNRFENEAADLLYHFLILLKVRGCNLEHIENILKERGKS